MRFLLTELATACDGKLIEPPGPRGGGRPGWATSVDGVSIDSRSVTAGQLFVPLVAERDGHDFIDGAIRNGAAAYLTSQSSSQGSSQSSSQASSPSAPMPSSHGVAAIACADTGAALTAIGELARTRLDGPVIGITGSVGKTSVKDLTLAACNTDGRAWASAASFNNELGVPLTLANAPADSRIAILEMGARGVGHIAGLCLVGRPTIGVVTRVALAHSELFGSLEAVARAKGELVEALPAAGTAVLNADDPLVLAMAARTEAEVLTYGLAGTGRAPDVGVESVALDDELRPSFVIVSDWGSAEVTLGVRGAHMAHNAAGAVAAALAAGVPFDDAVAGLASTRLSPWRMDVGRTSSGLLIINDAYNANPTSMRAALASLTHIEARLRVAVVGAMAELGPEGPAEHAAVAREAADAGVRVIAVDAPAYGAAAEHVPDRDRALELLDTLGDGDAVLVKGSRVAELEQLAERLLQQG